MSVHAKATTWGPKRWFEQQWLLDTVIRAENIDWDQPRSGYTLRVIGTDAAQEFNWAKARIKKYEDIAPAFIAAAARRECSAKLAEEKGHFVTAREDYFAAAIMLTPAAWAICDDDEELRRIYDRLNANYDGWIRYAPHKVQRFQIPFGNAKIPALLHLPPGYSGGRVPTILASGGMDSRKELQVAQYGERFLSRGFAVLAVDGPGQGEAPLLGAYVTEDNWIQAGEAMMKFLLSRPEVDPDKIACFATSFGSYWMTQVAITQPQMKGCVVERCCHEPGCHMIFECASPTYKKRFMWMTDLHDEAEFDRMAAKMDLRPMIGEMKVPWLNIIGEKDELSPIVHTLNLAARCGSPSPIVVYEGERHALSGSPSLVLGPKYNAIAGDWLLDRMAGKPAEEYLDWVTSSGAVERRPHPRTLKK